MIDLTTIPKDCDCITHDGLHWLHVDRQRFEANIQILQRGGELCLYAFAQEEAVRLQEKHWHMRRYTEDEQEEFIFPDGYRERDYEAQRREVWNAS